MAGKESQKPSFDFMRTNKPQNINIAKPKEDRSRIRSYSSPIKRPHAPKNCEVDMKSPN